MSALKLLDLIRLKCRVKTTMLKRMEKSTLPRLDRPHLQPLGAFLT